MIDEIFDRAYQAGREQMNAGIVNGLRGVLNATRQAFEVLNRIEYQAPWSERSRNRPPN